MAKEKIFLTLLTEKNPHFFLYLQKIWNNSNRQSSNLLNFTYNPKKEQPERQIKNEEKFQKQILELKQDNDRKQLENDKKKQLEISKLIHKAILTKENKSDEKICSQNTIWSTIETFNYNPEEDQTFERFYQKYQDFFDIDCQTWTDEKKIEPFLLLKYIITLSLILYSYYLQSLSCKYSFL